MEPSPVETALILCAEGNNAGRLMLGLSMGERLLLTLEKAGVRRIAFAGSGERPASSRAQLEVIPLEAGPGDRDFLLVPADGVVPLAALQAPADPAIPLPFRVLPASQWQEAAGNPDSWLGQWKNRVTDEPSARQAERTLIRSLHKTADGVISRNLNRRISTAISRRLAPLPIRPNHITAVVLLIGLASGPLASAGTYMGFAAGAFCYWLSAVLDGCDGEIARLKFMGTRLGAWLDTVVDDVVGLSYVAGMFVGLSARASHPYWTWIGVWAIGFYLLTLLPRYYIMASRSGSGDYQKLAARTRPEPRHGVGRAVLWMRDVVFRTDFMPFAALVTALLGVVQAFAVPFALGSVASCIDSFSTLASFRVSQSRK